jgi:hypothetical protein
MTIKYPEGMDFSWKEKRIPFQIFLDNMYRAYLLELEMHSEKHSLSKSEYYENNQDFLLTKFKEQA